MATKGAPLYMDLFIRDVPLQNREIRWDEIFVIKACESCESNLAVSHQNPRLEIWSHELGDPRRPTSLQVGELELQSLFH